MSASERVTRSPPDLEGLLRAVPTQSEREADRAAIWQEIAVDPPTPSERWAGSVGGQRRLLLAVAVVTALVVLASVILAILDATGQAPLATAPSSPVTHTTTAQSGAWPAMSRHTHRAPGRTAATLPAGAAAPGAAPGVALLSPSSGGAGQVITITGSNFVSPDGHIAANFGGQPASIVCPAPSTCRVTVPTLTGTPNPIRVTVTTDAGVSNAARFTYQ